MSVESSTVNGIFMDGDNASYDKNAKKFLSEKALLARIHFDSIKKVYTIWLVMDAPRGGSNSIRRYEINEKILHGHGHEDVKNYDLMVAIMVYLGKKKTRHRLLRLLHLIFLDKMKAAEKTKVLKDEYDLVLTPDMERELIEMGSLAEGIAERAKVEEILKSIRNLMKNMKLSAKQAMDVLEIPASEQEKYMALI